MEDARWFCGLPVYEGHMDVLSSLCSEVFRAHIAPPHLCVCSGVRRRRCTPARHCNTRTLAWGGRRSATAFLFIRFGFRAKQFKVDGLATQATRLPHTVWPSNWTAEDLVRTGFHKTSGNVSEIVGCGFVV